MSVRRTRSPLPRRLAWLALCLPLALAPACGEQEGAAKTGSPAAEAGAPGTEAGAAAAQVSPEVAAQVMRGVSGVIVRASANEIFVRDLGEGTRGRGSVKLGGGPETQVSGLKQSFDALRKGDLVAVSYQGDPPRAVGVRVLPIGVSPELAALAGGDPYKKRGREFVGWIKQVDDTTLVLRTPDAWPPAKRKGQAKTFVRQEGTVVEMLRSSWDELKKGDRVVVEFRKGEPRPADRVKVVLRGGEKPLPRGLATLLFDPTYDETVKDVDGIGEWPPDKPWPPVEGATQADAPPAAKAPAP